MIKDAQRKSMDPVQQRLRQSKSVWNKEVSAFINDLIHLKKLMNGWPNKFHKERSRITEPVPADPATILGSLAGDFQEIAQRGNALVQQQIQYSQTRRRPQPKTPEAPEAPATPATPATPVAPTPAPAAPSGAQLTKQLAASFETKYGLVAEGSNPFSRFLARMTTYRGGFSGAAQERRLRMDLLKAALKTYRALGRLQVEVSKSSKQSVVDAYKQMKVAFDQWSTVSRNFVQYVNTLPASAISPTMPQIPEMKEEVYSPEREEREQEELVKPWENFGVATDIMSDYRGYGHLFDQEDEGQLAELGNTIAKMMKVPKPQKLAFTQAMLDQYQRAISSLNRKLGTSGKSLKEIYQVLNKQRKEQEKIPPSQRPFKTSEPFEPPPQPPLLPEKYQASDQLEVVAQAFLQKWLGKLRHQSIPGKSSGVRLQIFELATNARKNVDKTMDVLEKTMDVQTLGPLVAVVTQQINTIRSLMRSLHNTEKPAGKGGGGGALEGFF